MEVILTHVAVLENSVETSMYSNLTVVRASHAVYLLEDSSSWANESTEGCYHPDI